MGIASFLFVLQSSYLAQNALLMFFKDQKDDNPVQAFRHVGEK